MDVTPYIQAKSDQLNADDLLGGPVVVQVERVTEGNAEQPVVVRVSGGHMPWKPCKTMRRVLVAAWGPDSAQWHGRWMRLYRDPDVKFGKEAIGGVRIGALSHIDGPMTLALSVSKGKKQQHRIEVLRPSDAQPSGAPTANLAALLEQAGLPVEAVDAWRHARGKGPIADLGTEEAARFAAWLAGDASRIESIRQEAAGAAGEASNG